MNRILNWTVRTQQSAGSALLRLFRGASRPIGSVPSRKSHDGLSALMLCSALSGRRPPRHARLGSHAPCCSRRNTARRAGPRAPGLQVLRRRGAARDVVRAGARVAAHEVSAAEAARADDVVRVRGTALIDESDGDVIAAQVLGAHPRRRSAREVRGETARSVAGWMPGRRRQCSRGSSARFSAVSSKGGPDPLREVSMGRCPCAL